MEYLQTTDEDTVAESILKQFPGTSKQSVADSIRSYKRIDAWTTRLAMNENAFNNLQTVMENAKELKKRVEYGAITENAYANGVYDELYKVK